MPSARDQLVDTLADSYRRVIDQEETVWRSLPFFAAVLALELNALFIALAHLSPAGTWRWVEATLLVLDAITMLATLGVVTASIFPTPFDYVAGATDLLKYATDLDSYATTTPGFDAAAELRANLADQQALAIDHNWHINQRRVGWRSLAGILAMLSIALTILLAFVELISNILNHHPL